MSGTLASLGPCCNAERPRAFEPLGGFRTVPAIGASARSVFASYDPVIEPWSRAESSNYEPARSRRRLRIKDKRPRRRAGGVRRLARGVTSRAAQSEAPQVTRPALLAQGPSASARTVPNRCAHCRGIGRDDLTEGRRSARGVDPNPTRAAAPPARVQRWPAPSRLPRRSSSPRRRYHPRRRTCLPPRPSPVSRWVLRRASIPRVVAAARRRRWPRALPASMTLVPSQNRAAAAATAAVLVRRDTADRSSFAAGRDEAAGRHGERSRGDDWIAPPPAPLPTGHRHLKRRPSVDARRRCRPPWPPSFGRRPVHRRQQADPPDPPTAAVADPAAPPPAPTPAPLLAADGDPPGPTLRDAECPSIDPDKVTSPSDTSTSGTRPVTRMVAAASTVSDEATRRFTIEPSLCFTGTNDPWKQSWDGELGSVMIVQFEVTSSALAVAFWAATSLIATFDG